ncbi:dihydroorotate dehydrogenase (quinone), mitochondrial [Drosophila sulfurigaster albostrigata]|uniref:dihydroorotate dehydrogenase (quinone), mitochondrial n=1 Tax=Drosophila sulfurigaster albostrigata TaxID=89887 RepID=UPI002D21ED8A|nr:dihydroorotate dehydrogenase (quinone), mitochondrial [Drosophila sulfurigaster albostrigata]
MNQFNSLLRTMLQSTRKINRLRSLGIVTTGAAALCLGITVYHNQDHLFRSFVMPVVRLLPAETSHNLAVLACKYRLCPTSSYMDDMNLHNSFFGRLISNPIGIAAGFDKNAEAICGLKDLGFGFIEIGSVTPLAQEGNDKPRVFRLINDRAIINRYGFNSDGHDVVADRLRKLREREDFNAVVGVNLGRNRDTQTPVNDYVSGIKTFGPMADYLVVNVSSPNTHGLRDLQSKSKLTELLEAVNHARAELKHNEKVPILLKLSPDLDFDDMKDIVAVINKKNCRVDGLIVSNTTVARDNITDIKFVNEMGGLSGEPLRARSTMLIAQMYELTKGSIPIIGVGGVSSGQDAFEKIEAGASFVQIYTALAYEGPDVVDRIKEQLSSQLKQRGFSNVRAATGSNYKQYLPSK